MGVEKIKCRLYCPALKYPAVVVCSENRNKRKLREKKACAQKVHTDVVHDVSVISDYTSAYEIARRIKACSNRRLSSCSVKVSLGVNKNQNPEYPKKNTPGALKFWVDKAASAMKIFVRTQLDRNSRSRGPLPISTPYEIARQGSRRREHRSQPKATKVISRTRAPRGVAAAVNSR